MTAVSSSIVAVLARPLWAPQLPHLSALHKPWLQDANNLIASHALNHFLRTGSLSIVQCAADASPDSSSSRGAERSWRWRQPGTPSPHHPGRARLGPADSPAAPAALANWHRGRQGRWPRQRRRGSGAAGVRCGSLHNGQGGRGAGAEAGPAGGCRHWRAAWCWRAIRQWKCRRARRQCRARAGAPVAAAARLPSGRAADAARRRPGSPGRRRQQRRVTRSRTRRGSSPPRNTGGHQRRCGVSRPWQRGRRWRRRRRTQASAQLWAQDRTHV